MVLMACDMVKRKIISLRYMVCILSIRFDICTYDCILTALKLQYKQKTLLKIKNDDKDLWRDFELFKSKI